MADAKTMTNSERSRRAAEARWNVNVPKATHTGILIIAGQEIHCDVLQDGRRILRQKTLLSAMGRGKIGGSQRRGTGVHNLPVFIQANNLTPYLEPKFLEGSVPIHYKGIDGRKLVGYNAIILPEACKVYVKADDDGVFKDPAQKKIAAVCRAMLYGLAEVGVIALIDECTGYEFAKQRNELQVILESYISKDLMPWTKKFPDEFFEQVYRLHGWQWPKINKNHPQYVGKLINDYVYDALPTCVVEELKTINPTNEKGNRLHRHHQWLTDSMGNKTLEKQVAKVVTLMKVSDNIDQFKTLMEKA